MELSPLEDKEIERLKEEIYDKIIKANKQIKCLLKYIKRV